MSRLKKTILTAAAFISLLACYGKAKADGLVNEIPSCYEANHIRPFGPRYDKLFVVLIDQTVLLDDNLQQQVLQSISTMIQPGTLYIIGEFSAFSQGRYLNILASGIAEDPIPANQIGNIPIVAVDPFKHCMSDQLNYATQSAEKAAYNAMQDASSSLDQSDILMAMKDISTRFKQTNVPNKALLVVTDGLEYSSITSFYAHATVRNINPDTEMQKVNANSMTGDFGGARVYVIGGADEPPAKVGTKAQLDGYRNPQIQMHLQQFWQDYFKASNANLVAFGEPALLSLPSWGANHMRQ